MFYQPVEKHSPRIVVAVVLGLTFFLAWGSLYLHLIGFSDTSYMGLQAQLMALTIGYLAVMFFAVFFARIIVPLKSSTTIPFLTLAIVGVFFGGYSYLVPSIALLLGIIGALFIGIENGWLLLLWSEFFGYVDSRCAGFSFAASFTAASALYYGACMLPHLAQVLIAAVLPVMSTLVIIFGAKALASGVAAGEFAHRRRKSSGIAVRYPWRTSKLFGLLRPAFVTTAVFAMVFVITAMHFGGLSREVAGYGILGIVLLLMFMLFAKKMTMKRLFHITLPVMGLGLALLPVDSDIGMTIIGCAYSMILYLLMLTLCEVANRFETSVVRLTGFAFGSNLLACIVGEIIGLVLAHSPLSALVSASSLSIVLLVAFITYIALAGNDGGFIFDFSHAIVSGTVDTENTAKAIEFPSGSGHKETETGETDRFDPRNMTASVVVFHEAVNQRCELVAARFGLSAREEEVLDFIMQGSSLQETADKMFISTGTVKTHINHIYKKTGTQNRTELKSIVFEIGHDHLKA